MKKSLNKWQLPLFWNLRHKLKSKYVTIPPLKPSAIVVIYLVPKTIPIPIPSTSMVVVATPFQKSYFVFVSQPKDLSLGCNL